MLWYRNIDLGYAMDEDVRETPLRPWRLHPDSTRGGGERQFIPSREAPLASIRTERYSQFFEATQSDFDPPELIEPGWSMGGRNEP